MSAEASKHDIDWQLHFARPLEPTLLQGEPNNVAMEAISRCAPTSAWSACVCESANLAACQAAALHAAGHHHMF